MCRYHAVRKAYGKGGQALSEFSRENLIPTPFDPRLLVFIAPEVVRAAQEGGVAKRPIEDIEAYARGLTSFVYRTNTFMGRLYQRAAKKPRVVVFADGEEERTLRAVRASLDENMVVWKRLLTRMREEKRNEKENSRNSNKSTFTSSVACRFIIIY